MNADGEKAVMSAPEEDCRHKQIGIASNKLARAEAASGSDAQRRCEDAELV